MVDCPICVPSMKVTADCCVQQPDLLNLSKKRMQTEGSRLWSSFPHSTSRLSKSGCLLREYRPTYLCEMHNSLAVLSRIVQSSQWRTMHECSEKLMFWLQPHYSHGKLFAIQISWELFWGLKLCIVKVFATIWVIGRAKVTLFWKRSHDECEFLDCRFVVDSCSILRSSLHYHRSSRYRPQFTRSILTYEEKETTHTLLLHSHIQLCPSRLPQRWAPHFPSCSGLGGNGDPLSP